MIAGWLRKNRRYSIGERQDALTALRSLRRARGHVDYHACVVEKEVFTFTPAYMDELVKRIVFEKEERTLNLDHAFNLAKSYIGG